MLVDAAEGYPMKLGQPALYGMVDPAPGADYYLVSILRKPFSRLLPSSGFARDVELWDRQGNTVLKLASLPSREGVAHRRRSHRPALLPLATDSRCNPRLGRGARWG